MRTIRILQPVLIVLMVHIILTVFVLQYYQGDISCLVHAGTTFTQSAQAPKGLCQQDGGDGYDGQFFYRFAVDPFSNQLVSHGIALDRAAYRAQRIFYPLLAWVLSAGNSAWVPAAFLLINLASILALTALSAIYALEQGRSPYWSLALGLYLGFLIAYILDLAHALQILLMFASIFLIRRGNGWWAAVLLACAILTRETSLLFAGAVLVIAFYQRWPRWYIYLLPVGVYGLWQAFLAWYWHGVPNLTDEKGMVFPLTGMISGVSANWQSGDIFGVIVFMITVAFGIATLFALRRSTAPLYVKLAWLFYSGLALIMTFQVWAKFNGYLRILSEWYFISCLVIFPTLRLPSGRWTLRRSKPTTESAR